MMRRERLWTSNIILMKKISLPYFIISFGNNPSGHYMIICFLDMQAIEQKLSWCSMTICTKICSTMTICTKICSTLLFASTGQIKTYVNAHFIFVSCLNAHETANYLPKRTNLKNVMYYHPLYCIARRDAIHGWMRFVGKMDELRFFSA